MNQVNHSEIIELYVDIGRGIFQKYFTPTAFRKFDGDHKLSKIIEEIFKDRAEIVSLFSDKAAELQRKISNENATNILLGKPRVDFEDFIAESIGRDSQEYELFKVLLNRMESHENEEKDRVFQEIDEGNELSDDDYNFVMELLAYERCSLTEFQKLYKFVRNVQFNEGIIIAGIGKMKDKKIIRGFSKLIQEKGSDEGIEILKLLNK